jgi:hypothetical protein
MATPTVATPDISSVVNQQYFIEPLGGPQHPQNYLDRFPETLYDKSLDSHFVRFMFALLGPSGTGWLQKNYLTARLQFEELGVNLFDLDSFFANPLRFGRIFEEVYDEDPNGLLPRDEWQKIAAQDAQYRARALDYVRGMRLGNTPAGIKLVARAGLGHECEVIENHQWLFDQHMDRRRNLDRYGISNSSEEFTIIPRRETAQSEIQRVSIIGLVTGGFFRLEFPSGNSTEVTGTIPFDAHAHSDYDVTDPVHPIEIRIGVEDSLAKLPSIGTGNVEVNGGPLPGSPIEIRFIGALAEKDVPKLVVQSALLGDDVDIKIETIRGGVESKDELVAIAPRDQHYLMSALDYLRPVTSIVSFKEASGSSTRNLWNTIKATSNYVEVNRYVTGNPHVAWPPTDTRYWIEPNIEHVGHKTTEDLEHHYVGFHNIGTISATTDDGLKSEHTGRFTPLQRGLFRVLDTVSDDEIMTADRASADYSEPLTITTQQQQTDRRGLINRIYPAEYQGLIGITPPKYPQDQFWASLERPTGVEYLEVDLGAVQAVNYVCFECLRKPFDIALDFDVLDYDFDRCWIATTPSQLLPFTTSVKFGASYNNPWESVSLNFTDTNGQMIFTRFLRIKLTRRLDFDSPFVNNSEPLPTSIEVRNLRAGRLVAP